MINLSSGMIFNFVELSLCVISLLPGSSKEILEDNLE